MTAAARAATPFVLATDLDGTFAGGSDAARARLYRRLAARTHGTFLIYVTGRHLDSARALEATLHLPVPDVYVTDVGATVTPANPERSIALPGPPFEARWPGPTPVLAALAEVGDFLDRQDIPTARRVSFCVRGDRPFDGVVHEVRRRLVGLDVTVVASAGTYVDVLPGGVDKGSTLDRLLAWLGIDREVVVVAGDTLNDAALFELGVKGIVVGNAEPALRERVGGAAHVYCAEGHGAAGVQEGLEVFGFFSEGSEA
ncbi:MAG TPA: HAD family hydrolase [Gemmatimonadales bacterium]